MLLLVSFFFVVNFLFLFLLDRYWALRTYMYHICIVGDLVFCECERHDVLYVCVYNVYYIEAGAYVRAIREQRACDTLLLL